MTDIERILEDLKDGRITVEQATRALDAWAYTATPSAKLDTGRQLRTGVPEAVFAEGKTAEQVVEAALALMGSTRGAVVATRCSDEQIEALVGAVPGAEVHVRSGTVVLRRSELEPLGPVAVISAGTSDGAVAEEALAVAGALSIKTEALDDVGVAGIHRLLDHADTLRRAEVAIVVAGMEGALPSVVAGLTRSPVIAVPTSVGYGAGAGGITPLLAMMNSCAPGVAVVNIDNGFGAAVMASKILRR